MARGVGGRDRLRRLGARRPGARRARDGAARAPRPPDRVGQPARRRRARSRCAPAAWSRRCRTATRWSAATASTRSARSPTRSRARGGRRRPRAPRPRSRSRGRARRRSPGSSVAMPSGYGPSRGQHDAGVGRSVADEDLHLSRAASARRCPPHPLGGPQPAFCDLEEHNALTAHQERERLASQTERRRIRVADEAYRAVFLRVHPTGKMVLSLTTEADGKEPELRRARRRGARRPGARREGRPGGHRPLRRRSRLQHEPVGGHAARRSRARAAKIRDKGRLLAAMALDAPPDSLDVGRTARGSRRRRATA